LIAYQQKQPVGKLCLEKADIITMNTGATTEQAVTLPEIEKLVITVIVDNYYDRLRPSTDIIKRYYITPGTSIHAEHGLAYHIEAAVDGVSHAFLFDYGMDYSGVSNNMNLLDIDMKKVEALGLSHGHFDHWGNLVAMLKHEKKQLRKDIPLYVGAEAFAKRYTKKKDEIEDLDQLRQDDIERLGCVKIMNIKDPTPIVPGACLTGEIARKTEYEKGSQASLIQRGDTLEQDLFRGEQGLVFHVKNKGLVVVTSCAHAGVVNTVQHARTITGVEKVHAILGGFHLINAKPEVIEKTVADIKAIKPHYVVPMHCAGFEAAALFAREMPDQFILNTAGARYMFTA
jgi:7,8-dihydropterin-6-yl-methyl-4-(beta-D-ribofuranosyl)aminobenzene 5'-phosphate synthase